MNPCFDLLDRAVIDGRGDDPVLRTPGVSHAQLLEDVAAVAGVFRAVGVAACDRVAVRAEDDLHAVISALAVLRLGAVPTTDGAAVAVEDREGATHLVWGDDSELDWPGVIRAGRTDPAPAHETRAGDPASHPDLSRVDVPLDVAELRSLLFGV